MFLLKIWRGGGDSQIEKAEMRADMKYYDGMSVREIADSLNLP